MNNNNYLKKKFALEEYKICHDSYIEQVKIILLTSGITYSLNGVLLTLISSTNDHFRIFPITIIGISSLLCKILISARERDICERIKLRMKELEKTLDFDFINTINGKIQFKPNWLYSHSNRLLVILVDFVLIFIWMFIVISTFFNIFEIF